MNDKERIELLENIIWDMLRNLHFKWAAEKSLWVEDIKKYRKLLEENPHIKKRLEGTRTLTRFTFHYDGTKKAKEYLKKQEEDERSNR